jgi:ribosome-associated protein YbcJ (S4-like RNA binding protein)
MVELISVKVLTLGKPVIEVMIPNGSTVKDALIAAGKTVNGIEELRRNGKMTSTSDIVEAGNMLTIVPAIKGGGF